MSSINELAQEIHENAVKHGWWDEPRSFGEVVALCHSELSEALEEYRDGKPNIYGTCLIAPKNCEYRGLCPHNPDLTNAPCKPEGIAVELADCIIRILDYCGHENIDIERIIAVKHEYNKTRRYRHGGKII